MTYVKALVFKKRHHVWAQITGYHNFVALNTFICDSELEQSADDSTDLVILVRDGLMGNEPWINRFKPGALDLEVSGPEDLAVIAKLKE